MRAIVAGAVALPKARLGRVAVPAPDEDGFTLAVEAADRVPGLSGAHIETVHLVGPLPAWLPEALPDALGTGPLAPLRYAPGPAGLWAAVEAASARAESGTTDLILAFDPGPAPGGPTVMAEGSGVAALAVAERGGLRITGRTIAPVRPAESRRTRPRTRSRPPASPQGSRTPAPIWIRRGPSSDLPEGAEGAQGRTDGGDPAAGPGFALASLLPIVEALREISSGTELPDSVALVDPLPLGTETITFESTAPVAWPERPSLEASAAIWSDADALLGSGSVPATISEGAYLPRATYLANRPSRWRLAAEECGACHALTFPIRGECRACGRRDQIRRIELPRRGLVVEATTTIRPGAQPTEFDHQVARSGPYSVLIARAHPSVRITVQLTDARAGAVRAGERVDLVLRRVYPMEGEWRYGLKAIPTARDRTHDSPPGTGAVDVSDAGTGGVSRSKTQKGVRGSREAG